jgi:phosphate transport system substrate-binding protein
MKMKPLGKIALALVTIIGLCSWCQANDLKPFEKETGELRISGGTAHIPVMKEAAKLIMTANPDIRISIAGGGSGVGIKQVGEGLTDIGNSGRKPTDDEIKKYQLNLFKWAIDGVGVVVHPQNRVKALTRNQLKAIFSGRLVNWQGLGGHDKPINLYTRDEASGTREVFWKKALDKGDIAPVAHVVVSNGAMKTAVATDPYAIGYVSVGYIDPSVAAVSLDGVAPTIENVRQGSYVIARGLYSNTKGKPSGLTAKFIDFLFSDQGQRLAAEKGFIPVR